MATFKAVIDPRSKRRDGTFNIKIRITHNRKSRYLSTPFYVPFDKVTRSYKIKDTLISDKIDSHLLELRNKYNELGFVSDTMDIDHIVSYLSQKPETINFTDFMDRYCGRLEKEERFSTASTYRIALNSLLRFSGNRPITFREITKQYIYEYWQSLNNLKDNTKISYITLIKTVYKRAQKELNDDDTGIIVVRHGVFDLIEMPKETSLNELAFEKVEDMQAVIDAPYTGTWAYDFAKDLFIFSFACFGINYADIKLLEKADYKDGIITFKRKKVSRRLGGSAEMKIKVPYVARIIIEKYSGDDKYLIDFRGHTREQNVCRYIHAAFQDAGLEPKTESYLPRAGHLKSKYTFYSARHTMATFARNICGIDKLTVHEMLNHATPQDMKTTDVYLRRDYSHLWEANEKLMSLFDWSFYTNQK